MHLGQANQPANIYFGNMGGESLLNDTKSSEALFGGFDFHDLG